MGVITHAGMISHPGESYKKLVNSDKYVTFQYIPGKYKDPMLGPEWTVEMQV